MFGVGGALTKLGKTIMIATILFVKCLDQKQRTKDERDPHTRLQSLTVKFSMGFISQPSLVLYSNNLILSLTG